MASREDLFAGPLLELPDTTVLLPLVFDEDSVFHANPQKRNDQIVDSEYSGDWLASDKVSGHIAVGGSHGFGSWRDCEELCFLPVFCFFPFIPLLRGLHVVFVHRDVPVAQCLC
jgi:hypothetical protein